MHILVVHNRYRGAIPSGENVVVDGEISALREAGHRVTSYLRSSDELAVLSLARKLRMASSPIWSPTAIAAVDRLIETDRPDVLHLHNPYPLISMAVVRAAHARGVPVIQTIHNHRHTCMKGTYQREGRSCRDCLKTGNPVPGVVHACYRDSRPQSAIMAVALIRHRNTVHTIDQYVALTPEISESLLASGFDATRIHIKPNSVPDPGPVHPLGSGFAYIGRLSEEKGVLVLLRAWASVPAGKLGTLLIAGDGPARSEVDRLAADRADVEVLGILDAEGVRDTLRRTAVVIVPSQWPEALPLVVLEAMAAGRALLVTNQGGLPRIVDREMGHVVAPDVESIATGLAYLARDEARLRSMSAAARLRYERSYNPSVVTAALIGIYELAIAGAA